MIRTRELPTLKHETLSGIDINDKEYYIPKDNVTIYRSDDIYIITNKHKNQEIDFTYW